MATSEFDVSDLPVEGEKPVLGQNLDMSKSVLSPDYRARTPLGAQEIGGLIGSIGGVDGNCTHVQKCFFKIFYKFIDFIMF